MKKLLIAQDLKPQIADMMTLLERADIVVFTAATSEEMLQVHTRERADLVVTRPDLPGMGCETLLNIFRRSTLLRNAAVILVCDDTPAQRDRCNACGPNAVMTKPISPAVMERHVQEFLHVMPRRSYRVVLNMSVEGRQNGKAFLCSTENLSRDGMLIRTAENLSPGNRITCSFFLPDGTRISAGGAVARAAGPDKQSRQNRYGIHLSALTPEAKTALSAFVSREQRNAELPPRDMPIRHAS